MRYALGITNQRILKIMRNLTSITQRILSCPAHSQFLNNNKTKLTNNKTKLTFLSLKIY
jgi:hypothetical protein